MEYSSGQGPQPFVVDEVTNHALSDFPVSCSFRMQEIQQPFLHTHSGYELYLCLSGHGRLLAGRTVHDISAGSLAVIAPDALHMPRSAPGEPFRRYIVSIDRRYLEGLDKSERERGSHHRAAGEPGEGLATADDSERGEAGAVGRWLPPERDGAVCWQLNARQLAAAQQVLEQLEQELRERRAYFSWSVRSLLLQLFVRLGRYGEEEVPSLSVGGERKRMVEELMELIAGRCTEPIRMEELCGRFGLSRSYLHRIFKQETGLTIMEYLIVCRMNMAKGYLRSSSIPLAEVALASGFQDLSHFCRMFKRLTGITPGQYRRHPLELKREI